MLLQANTINQQGLQNTAAVRKLKKGIWLYFLLLIFEGALRKWFLPALATPLLIIRDPLALWLLLLASKERLLPFNIFSFSMIVIAVISFLTTLVLGHGNLQVAVFGARILMLQFPLIFVIGRIFDKEDVLKLGKVMVYLTPFMAVLIAIQFYSPQSAWVNRGVGGDAEGAGFSGALDFFRPPGTFSFTNGTALFFGFASPFIFYYWYHPGRVSKLILLMATIGLLAAIPFSISRTLFFSISVTLLFVLIASFYQPKFIGGMILTSIGGLVALAILSVTPLLSTAIEAFTVRFTTANEVEGGLGGVLGDRYLGGLLSALTYSSSDYPFFGRGLGMGTNVGAQLLAGDKTVFLISEGEWGRLIGEMGPLLGVLAILVRLLFSGSMVVASFRKLTQGDLLPWLLLGFTLLNIPQGQWSQPTALGFSVLSAGLVMASSKTS